MKTTVCYYEIEIENGDEDFNVKLNAEDLSVIEQDMDRNDDRDDRDDDRDDDEMIAMMMEKTIEMTKVKTTVMMTNQHRTAQTSKLKIKKAARI